MKILGVIFFTLFIATIVPLLISLAKPAMVAFWVKDRSKVTRKSVGTTYLIIWVCLFFAGVVCAINSDRDFSTPSEKEVNVDTANSQSNTIANVNTLKLSDNANTTPQISNYKPLGIKRSELIRKIKAFDNSLEMKKGVDIDGLENYVGEDNYNNNLQIIGTNESIKSANWTFFPNRSKKRTAVSAMRMFTVAATLSGKDGTIWVSNRIHDILDDIETDFSDSTMVSDKKLVIQYIAMMHCTTLTVSKPLESDL
jgi:hypothetical protein